MGLLQAVGRFLLVIINILLVIVSLVLITFGFLVKYSDKTFKKYTDPILDDITDSVKGSFGTSDFSADKFEFGELFGSTATIIIIIGFVLLAISFFGSCGACCGVKCMLLLYSVILIVLVLAQIVFVVFLFGYPETLKKATRKPLKSLLKNFRGLNGTNIESVGWNFIMYEFGCCGLDNSDDFKQGDSSWFGEDDADWKTPVACCETLPTTSNDFSCAKANGNNVLYNNYKWGCVDEVWLVLIEDNRPYTYIGAGGILAFQLLMIVFALVLYCKDDENQVSPMEQNSRKKGKRNPRSSW